MTPRKLKYLAELQKEQSNPATTGTCPVCHVPNGKKCVSIYDWDHIRVDCNGILTHRARIDLANRKEQNGLTT